MLRFMIAGIICYWLGFLTYHYIGIHNAVINFK